MNKIEHNQTDNQDMDDISQNSRANAIKTQQPQAALDMNNPLISIITVVRNGRRHIEQTIKSVIDQSYENIEYIVIDGCSTDGTLDIIQKYDDEISYWASEPDAGLYHAMNKGVAASSGLLINLLNADDYLEADAVEMVVKEFRRRQCPCIICGHSYYVDERYSVRARLRGNMHYWLGMTINHQTMFVHRDVYQQTGLYNESLRYAADYDFYLKSIKDRTPYYPLERCIVNYRNSGISSVSASHYRREANVINKKTFGSLSFKRIAFILFNYLWMPFKLSLRTLLYSTLGVHFTRSLIAIIRNIRFH